MAAITFPPDFVWGVATSAYQIEGAPTADGKGESIWDRFAHTPGTVLDGATGDVACDSYHRYPEDVALMAGLGVKAYRFSIAWTRVLPDGDGAVNPAGLGYYDRLVDELLAHGIEPWPTLYHWDLPQALQDRGGWPERATVDAFARYAGVVAAALGDRVGGWMTINEPWVAAVAGHLVGVHAPGLHGWEPCLAAAHHLLLGHGRAVASIRAAAPGARVGIALDCRPAYPATDDPADHEATRHFDGFRNRWYFDPVFGRGYPEDMVAAYRERGRYRTDQPPFVRAGDVEEMGAPIDFLGINYYRTIAVRAGWDEVDAPAVPPGPDPPPGHTEMGWPITPEGLTAFLKRAHADYGPPSIYVTENGASFSDGPGPDGKVADERRIAYVRDHLAAVADARAAGVPVHGYFLWSLLDNFEWALAYRQRFGIVWVDHDTGARIPKQSFDWYRRVIAGGELEPAS